MDRALLRSDEGGPMENSVSQDPLFCEEIFTEICNEGSPKTGRKLPGVEVQPASRKEGNDQETAAPRPVSKRQREGDIEGEMRHQL